MSCSKQPNYREFTKKQTASNVWNNFMAADDRKTAKCKLCNKIIKTGGGSTSGLHTHMRTMHKEIKESSNEIGDIPIPTSSMTSASSTSSVSYAPTSSKTVEPSAKKVKLSDYLLSQNSMEFTVARMAALDGIPLSKFCTSTDLRRLFNKSGYTNLPKSPTTITNIILKESDNVKNNVKITFADLKNKVQRFALTFDEYTSTKNKRYMNINVHNKDFDHCKFKNLGLVRITGSLNATAGMQYLKDRLHDFELDLDEDIIAFTTDGASVMIKMGKDFKGHHQLCLAHGIQLAVIDVLYKNKFHDTSTTVSATICPETDTNDSGDDSDYYLTNEDDSYNILPSVAEGPKPEFIYKDLVKEVRTLVKLFRKSPTKNDMLQQYVAEGNQGHSEELILDCKTRWSSLSDMIGRFLKLKDSIAKVLIDLHLNFPLDDRSVEILQNVHTSLAVVKATVLAICRRDADLLTADAALKFMLNKLDEAQDDLSKNLAFALRKRIKERRTIISGVLQYLHDNESFYNDHGYDDAFKKPTGDEIHTTIVYLLTRLNYRNIEEKEPRVSLLTIPSTSTQDQDAVISQEKENITMEEELERELKNVRASQPVTDPSNDIDFSSIVRVEMCVYDSSGGGRGVFLTAAYNYLLSVVPTSVESERAFSSVGYLCNKLRSSLSDKTLNALSFLRSYYQSERERNQ